MKKQLALLSVALLLVIACRKEPLDLVNPDQRYTHTYAAQFDAIWHGMDNSYVFWDRDTVNWDSVYARFMPKFEELDKKGTVSDAELQKLYQQAFHGLLDHHLSVHLLNKDDQYVQHPIWFSPGNDEVTHRDYYHNSIADMPAQIMALKQKADIMYTCTGYGYSYNMWAARIPAGGQYIAYFRCGSFQISELVDMVRRGHYPDSVLNPLRFFYGTVLDGMGSSALCNSNDVKGIIFDVRGNGGGYTDELVPLVGAFLQQDLHWGYSRVKEGLGRLDYSPWTPFHIRAAAQHLNVAKPIVVLADCNSVSCSEVSTQTIKSLPNGIFIGERTWGATGPLIPGHYDLLYSGVFGDEDLHRTRYYVYTSNFDMVTADFTSLEGHGIEPDIEVRYIRSITQDNQLNRAIEYINTGK